MPGDKEMAEYSGEYFCVDVESLYRFSIDDDVIYVQFNFGNRKRLLPTTADVFIPDTDQLGNMLFRFSRDDSGKINGSGWISAVPETCVSSRGRETTIVTCRSFDQFH